MPPPPRAQSALLLLLGVQAAVRAQQPGNTSRPSPAPAPARDLAAHPVCVADADCAELAERSGVEQACFQYMCHPFSRPSTFRQCKKNSDCVGLKAGEGGEDGADGQCYRHHDRRRVTSGLCLNTG